MRCVFGGYPDHPNQGGQTPTNLQYYERDNKGFTQLPITNQIEHVCDDYECDPENGPWVIASETTLSGHDQFRNWLQQEVDPLYLEHWAPEYTQYLPGFEILRSLNKKQRDILGLREVDLGGPASSVPAVICGAPAELLQQVLDSTALPFKVEILG